MRREGFVFPSRGDGARKRVRKSEGDRLHNLGRIEMRKPVWNVPSLWLRGGVMRWTRRRGDIVHLVQHFALLIRIRSAGQGGGETPSLRRYSAAPSTTSSSARAGAGSSTPRGKGSGPPVTTRPRPVPRPVFAHLFFPCSAPKSPDNSLFRSLEIPCSAPAPARNRRVANPATP